MHNSMDLSTVPLYKLFLQMKDGVIQVPQFQRSYSWDEKNIIDLMESIKSGFPIGTIILAIDNNEYTLKDTKDSLFPSPKEDRQYYDERYLVIDGVQRLSTLYNCFNDENSKFDVWYDLVSKEFSFNIKKSKKSILLSSLFHQKAYFNTIKEIGMLDDDLLDELDDLYYTFKEYSLSIYRIKSIDQRDLITLFERINMSGLRLTDKDLENAKRFEMKKT